MAKYRKDEYTPQNVNIGQVKRVQNIQENISPKKVRPTTANTLRQSVPPSSLKFQKRQEEMKQILESENKQSNLFWKTTQQTNFDKEVLRLSNNNLSFSRYKPRAVSNYANRNV